jgi:hypothetical protein
VISIERIWPRLLATVILTSSLFVLSENASASELPFCRSTTGTGLTQETNVLRNGYYQQNNIRVEPVFPRKLRVDPTRGFDGAYIGYRLTNVSATVRSNIWIQISGLTPDRTNPRPIELVDSSEDRQFVGVLPVRNASNRHFPVGKYFFIRSSSLTELTQWHEVRIWNGLPNAVGSTVLASCRTGIEGATRSLAANANKVTSIVQTETGSVGGTIAVNVFGAPGTVGSGDSTDGSIIAMSAAMKSNWPVRSLRLEQVSLRVTGLKQNDLPGCTNGDPHSLQLVDSANNVTHGVLTGSEGSNRFAIYGDTLIVRNLNQCIKNPKATYRATYIFRILSPSAAPAVVAPVASISSGTQIKYTGSLPSTSTSIDLVEVAPEITATKSFVNWAASDSPQDLTHIDASYRVRVEVPTAPASGVTKTVRIDSIEDQLTGGGTLVSAQVQDFLGGASRLVSSANILATTDGDITTRRFVGPFEASRTSSTNTPVILDYVIRLARPASGTINYSNLAAALSGDYKIGTGSVVTGVSVVLPDDGAPTNSSFTSSIELREQRITFDPLGPFGAGVSVPLRATSDSGVPVTFSIHPGDTSVCDVLEFDGTWMLRTLIPGTCRIIANADGVSGVFDPADPVTQQVTVLDGQFITVNAGNFGSGSSANVTLSATSQLQVALVSIDTDVCTVPVNPASYNSATGETIYVVTRGTSTAGACVLVASQAGGASGEREWGPAPNEQFVIGVGREQTLSITSPTVGTSVTLVASGQTFVAQTGNITGTTSANSGSDPALSGEKRLPLQFLSLTPTVCRVTQPTNTDGELLSGLNTSTGVTTWTYTLLSPGTCTIEATQDGLDNEGIVSVFAPTTGVTRSVTVLSDASQNQYLFIGSQVDRTYGTDTGFIIEASSRSENNPTGALTHLLVGLQGTPSVCVVGSPSISLGITTAAVSIVGAGTCIITATQPGNVEYRLAESQTISVTIQPRLISIGGLSLQSRVYDGTSFVSVSGTAALNGVVPGDTPSQISLSGSPTGSYSNPRAGNGKSITVEGMGITGTKAGSYQLAPLTLTGTISKRPVDVDNLVPVRRQYDSTRDATFSGTPTLRSAASSASGRGVLIDDETALSITGAPVGELDSPDAGPRRVVVSGLSLTGQRENDYELASIELDITIDKRDIDVTPLDQSVKAGNANPATCLVSVDGLVAGDEVSSAECTYSSGGNPRNSDTEPQGAGPYTIQVTAASVVIQRGGNQDVTLNYNVRPGVNAQLTITDKDVPVLELDATSFDLVYGQTLHGRLGAQAKQSNSPSTTVPGRVRVRRNVSGGSPQEVSESTVLTAGSYTFVFEFEPTDTNDYEPVSVVRSVNVSRRIVRARGLSTINREYNGSIAVPLAGTLELEQMGGTGVATNEGVVTDDDIDLSGPASATLTGGSPDVGNNRGVSLTGVSLTGSKATNYELRLENTLTVNITARPIALRARDITIAPRDNISCAADFEDDTSLVDGESIDTLACNYVSGGQPADLLAEGTSDIVIQTVGMNPGKSSNYQVTKRNGTLTVARLSPVLTVETIETVYGDDFGSSLAQIAPVRSNNANVAGTVSHFRDVNNSPSDVTGGERINVGTHQITARFNPSDLVRYRSVEVTRNVVVSRRPVNITPVSKFKLVGQDDPTLTWSAAGVLDGDSATIDVDLSRTPGQAVGNYPITANSSINNANYRTVDVTGRFLRIGNPTIESNGGTIGVSGSTINNTLSCECLNFPPGATVTLTIFSTPLELGSGEVEDDGTCPFLESVNLPEDFPDGDHTLEMDIEETGAETTSRSWSVNVDKSSVPDGPNNDNPTSPINDSPTTSLPVVDTPIQVPNTLVSPKTKNDEISQFPTTGASTTLPYTAIWLILGGTVLRMLQRLRKNQL